jgi:plastocyanin
MKLHYKTISLAALLLCTAGLSQAGSLTVTVVDREGKPTQDAVVVLVPEAKGTAKMPLPTTTTIAQEKMQFIPAVSIVPVGAKVKFINNDPWDHHVRSSAAGAASFNAGASTAAGSTGAAGATASGAPAKGIDLRLEGKSDGKPAKSAEVTMDKAGPQSATLLGCYLHGSMRGHVYVTDSAWTLKTNADGVAVLDDVPDGKVSIKVWQADQLIDLPMQTTTVSAAPAKANVQLQVAVRRKRAL